MRKRLTKPTSQIISLSEDCKKRQQESRKSVIEEYKEAFKNENLPKSERFVTNLNGNTVAPEQLEKILEEAQPKDMAERMQQPDMNRKLNDLVDDQNKTVEENSQLSPEQQQAEKIKIMAQVTAQIALADGALMHIRALASLAEKEPSPSEMLLLNRQNNLLGKLLKKVNDPNVKPNAETMAKIFDQVKELNAAKNISNQTNEEINRTKLLLNSLDASIKEMSQKKETYSPAMRSR